MRACLPHVDIPWFQWRLSLSGPSPCSWKGLLEEEAQEKDHQYGIDRGAAHHELAEARQTGQRNVKRRFRAWTNPSEGKSVPLPLRRVGGA